MEWTAIATFVLALIATASIIVTLVIRERDIAENRRIREEDKELNFKLRLLDEVRDWAREAVKLGFLYERTKTSFKARLVFENMIEDVSKTTDVADMAAKIFAAELESPVTKAMGFVKD